MRSVWKSSSCGGSCGEYQEPDLRSLAQPSNLELDHGGEMYITPHGSVQAPSQDLCNTRALGQTLQSASSPIGAKISDKRSGFNFRPLGYFVLIF